MAPRIGILALQGAFSEHAAMLSRLSADPVAVRLPADLEGLHGIILPGGESTTMSRLMAEYGLFAPLQERARSGFPMMGTCAGLILLSRLDSGSYPATLGAMDVAVKRNAFGRQVDSFETDLRISALGEESFHGVFIRAPKIDSVGAGATVLCRLDDGGGPVAVRQGNLLGCSFHPELTADTRLHKYFLGIVQATDGA